MIRTAQFPTVLKRTRRSCRIRKIRWYLGPPPSHVSQMRRRRGGCVLLAELFSAGRRRVVGGRVLLGEGLPARGRARVMCHLRGPVALRPSLPADSIVEGAPRRPAGRRGRRAAARPSGLRGRRIRPRRGREPRLERGDLVRRRPGATPLCPDPLLSIMAAPACPVRQLSRATTHLQMERFPGGAVRTVARRRCLEVCKPVFRSAAPRGASLGDFRRTGLDRARSCQTLA